MSICQSTSERFMVYRNCVQKSNNVQWDERMTQCVHDSVCVCIKLSHPMYRASWQPGWNPLVNLSSLVLTHRLTFVSARCYLAQQWPHGQREADKWMGTPTSHIQAHTHTNTRVRVRALQQTSFCRSLQTDLRSTGSLKRWTKLDDGVR